MALEPLSNMAVAGALFVWNASSISDFEMGRVSINLNRNHSVGSVEATSRN